MVGMHLWHQCCPHISLDIANSVQQEKAKSDEKLRQQFAEEREQLQRTCDRRLAQQRQEYDSEQVTATLVW